MSLWQSMKYDPEQERWCVESSNGDYGLNCGTHLRMKIDGVAVHCRLELARGRWYVIMEGARFDLRDSDEYLVRL